MKFLPSFAVLALISVVVGASNPHDGIQHARHNKLARRGTPGGRCKANPSAAPSTSHSAAPSSWSSSTHHSTSTTKPASTPAPSKAASGNSSNGSSSNGNSIISAVEGLINIQWSSCGSPGATHDITPTTGPNGALNWFDCGINSGGWKPPYITLNDIVTIDLNIALQQAGTPFTACSNFVWAFYQYGQQYGIPPIILASFAMQESSCIPNTVGGAGEQGLMQLTVDKCGAAPGGNCMDVSYNIGTGAKYFSGTLDTNNGDLLKTIGQYNGWFPGMTYSDATAARWNGNCRAQNNLDYLHQFLNGWVLNYNAYTHGLGFYFNLDVCGN